MDMTDLVEDAAVRAQLMQNNEVPDQKQGSSHATTARRDEL